MPPATGSRSSTVILPTLMPRKFRRGGESRRPGAENDDVALDHSAILPAAMAATCALQ